MSERAEGCLWALRFYGHQRQVILGLRTKDKLHHTLELCQSFYISELQEKGMTDKLSFKFDSDFTLEGDAATFKKAVNTYIKLPKLLG